MDLLVINETDLAPMVGADLGVMARDGLADVIGFLARHLGAPVTETPRP